MLPKFRGALNVEVDPDVEPKSEGELKAEVAVPPKMDDDVLGPNAVLLAVPNNEGVAEVEPKGFDEEEPSVEPKGEDDEAKPVEPKGEDLGAKGFEGVAEENGFAAG